MKINFYKYQGTGNDFIMIDNRANQFPADDVALINKLCDRKFGIGADGLILLENDTESDFRMVYFNADGNQSTMCGNGGRCTVMFAKQMKVIEDETTFIAIDGLHYATIEDDVVNLQMIDVPTVEEHDSYSFLNTGSPHHVQLVTDLANYDVFTSGRQIRRGAPYFEEGANVNFVEKLATDKFAVRTYERGVEDETLSCGTGVTAVALAMYNNGQATGNNVTLQTPGGDLGVSFEKSSKGYNHIFLKGKATFVFKGEISW